MAASDDRHPQHSDPATGADGSPPGAESARRGTEYGVSDPAAPPRTSRWMLIAAVILPVILIAGVLIGARIVIGDSANPQRSELSVVGLPSPDADSPECVEVMSDLPDSLGDAERVDLREPAPPATAGYRLPNGDPVTVHCGVEAPPGFVVGVALQQVSGVQWFTEEDPVEGIDNTTYVAVDRPVLLAITLPLNSGTGAIQDLSTHIAEVLPAQEPQPAPIN